MNFQWAALILIVLFIAISGCTINIGQPAPAGNGTVIPSMVSTPLQTANPPASPIIPAPTTALAITGPTDTTALSSQNSPAQGDQPSSQSSGSITTTDSTSNSKSPTGNQDANSPPDTSGDNRMSDTANTSDQGGDQSPVIAYITTNEINRHFLDVTFGSATNHIEKWNIDLVPISLNSKFTEEDEKTLGTFINSFNLLSTTSKISTNVKENLPARFNFNYIPLEGMKQLDLKSAKTVFRDADTGELYYVTMSIHDGKDMNAYVNADLTGDKRAHYTIRALLSMLGFLGSTSEYPDSIFYINGQTNTVLTPIDKEVIKSMYGQTIKYYMNFIMQVQAVMVGRPPQEQYGI